MVIAVEVANRRLVLPKNFKLKLQESDSFQPMRIKAKHCNPITKSEKLNKIARITALISFFIGTLLLIIYYFTISDYILQAGLIYVGLALIINLFILIRLFFSLMQTDKTLKANTLKTIGLISLNIPVTLIYMYLVLVITSTVWVTIENMTGENLTELTVNTKSVRELKNNSRKTFRIKSSFRLSPIDIQYYRDGEKHEHRTFHSYGMERHRINIKFE